jgi:hypothetical protein
MRETVYSRAGAYYMYCTCIPRARDPVCEFIPANPPVLCGRLRTNDEFPEISRLPVRSRAGVYCLPHSDILTSNDPHLYFSGLIHCRVNLVVKIENPSSNLLEICSYISSFLHYRLVQTKSSFLLVLTWQKWFSITYKSNMKTTRQSFQMIAHCLFTSIDSNEKSREIRMRVIAG